MAYTAAVRSHEVTEIIGSTGASGDKYGSALDATDDYLVVAASEEHDGALANTGALHIYERDISDVWVHVARFAHSDSPAYLGCSVSIAGDWIAAGAQNANSVRGEVELYHRTGGVWAHTQTITSPLPALQTRFGRDVCFAENLSKLVVGTSSWVSGHTGFAWGYEYNSGTGLWDLTNDYRPADIAGNDDFGVSVAVSPDGSVVAIGSAGDDDGGSATGSVYVYTRGQPMQKINAATPVVNARFGNAVGVGANTIAVVSPWGDGSLGAGLLHIFEKIAGTWTQTKALSAKSARPSRGLGARQSYSQSAYLGLGRNHIRIIDDRIVLVPSAQCNTAHENHIGTLWIFDLSDDSYRAHVRSLPAATTRFGSACAISKNKLIVGCPENTAGFAAGSGIVYEYDERDWDPSYGSVTPVTFYFLMRGYRPGTSDFETWIAVGAPNSTNPSGQPIVDVTVQAKWTA